MSESKRRPKAGQQIALRVGQPLLTAIDAEVARLRRERPGANPHRSDAVREILHRALLQRSVARD
jgi:hypothetical protein